MRQSRIDLFGGLQELHTSKVDLFFQQQAFDITTPGDKAMFQMLGVFADDAESAVMRSGTPWSERTVA